MIVDLSLLEPELFPIIQLLELTAAAGPGHRTLGLYPSRRRLQDLHQPGKAIIFLHLHHRRLDHIPNERVLDEPGVAVGFSDPGPVLAHVLNGHGKYVVFLHAPSSGYFSWPSLVRLTLLSMNRL